MHKYQDLVSSDWLVSVQISDLCTVAYLPSCFKKQSTANAYLLKQMLLRD